MKKILFVCLVCISLFLMGCNIADVPPEPPAPGETGDSGDLAGQVWKAEYGDSYAEPTSFMIDKDEYELGENLQVKVDNEDFVYNTIYLATDDTDWQEFKLYGTKEEYVGNWVKGDAVANVPPIDVGVNYIVAYACTRVGNDWDCHDNMWMLHSFGVLPKLDPAPTVQCTDSDGGVNAYVKGITKGFSSQDKYIEFTDYCVTAKDYFPEKVFDLNPDLSYEDIGVSEGMCGDVIDGEVVDAGKATGMYNIPGPNWLKCKNGCEDGACNIPKPTPLTLSCNNDADCKKGYTCYNKKCLELPESPDMPGQGAEEAEWEEEEEIVDCTDLVGDINLDGVLDSEDTEEIAQMIKENYYDSCADINNDGDITVSDLQIVVNMINGDPEAAELDEEVEITVEELLDSSECGKLLTGEYVQVRDGVTTYQPGFAPQVYTTVYSADDFAEFEACGLQESLFEDETLPADGCQYFALYPCANMQVGDDIVQLASIVGADALLIVR